jgi:hypothetical protein
VGGFRSGLVIGVLGTAVIALGIAVFILATDEEQSTGKPAASSASDKDEPCLIEHNPQGERRQVEVDLRSSGLSCAEAEDVFHGLQAREAIVFSDIYQEVEREKGWACYGHPLAMYPVLGHCSAPGRRFLVLGLESSAHLGGAPPPPLPPSGTQLKCGDLAEDGYGTYNVQGNGVDCTAARNMAYIWEEVCLGSDIAPNPCPVVRRFSCSQNEVGIELVSIACIRGDHAVTFENGA